MLDERLRFVEQFELPADVEKQVKYSITIAAAGVLILLFLGTYAGVTAGMISDTDGETVAPELVSGGDSVGSVEAEVVETQEEMEIGLSDRSSLSVGEGMLFVHESDGEYVYGMPDMDFGIDIVFLDSSCEITAIHSAVEPASDETGLESTHRYSGEGKYVLEVPKGYASDRVDVGDEVQFRGGCGL